MWKKLVFLFASNDAGAILSRETVREYGASGGEQRNDAVQRALRAVTRWELPVFVRHVAGGGLVDRTVPEDRLGEDLAVRGRQRPEGPGDHRRAHPLPR